jgi:hypothetical protein
LRFDPSKKKTCLPPASSGCIGKFLATNTLAMAAPTSQHERDWMLLLLGPTEQAIQSTADLQSDLDINTRVRSMLKIKFSDYGADYSTLRDGTTGAGAVAEVTMNTLKSIHASTKGTPLLLHVPGLHASPRAAVFSTLMTMRRSRDAFAARCYVFDAIDYAPQP